MGKRFKGSSFIIVLLCVCQQVSSFTPCQIGRKQAVLPTMTTTSTKSAVTTADDILAPASNLPETKQHTNGIEKFLIHRGRSLCMIKRSPSIGGLGLCKGWTPKATKNFVDAIEKMGKNWIKEIAFFLLSTFVTQLIYMLFATVYSETEPDFEWACLRKPSVLPRKK